MAELTITWPYKPLTPEVDLTPIAFRDVPVGTKFWWGSYLPQRCNWGMKRSTRTADWLPLVNDQFTGSKTWSYWRANETVYIIN